MPQKLEEQLQKLTDEAVEVAWKIADKKAAPCRDQAPPPLEAARNECIVAFRAIALALRTILKLKPGRSTSG